MVDPAGDPASTMIPTRARMIGAAALCAALGLSIVVAVAAIGARPSPPEVVPVADPLQPRPLLGSAGEAPPVRTAGPIEMPDPALMIAPPQPPEIPVVAPLPPLETVVVGKRPEPKRPRDILFPGEVMKKERPIAAPPPMKPAMPAWKTTTTPLATRTPQGIKLPSAPGAKGPARLNLSPCAEGARVYVFQGFRTDATGHPCPPS